MEPIPAQWIKGLDLSAALDAEVSTLRNLVPPEPWLDSVKSNQARVCAWVGSELERGLRPAQSIVVNARKVGNGIRPVAVMGIVERLVYRALSTHVLKSIRLPDRTAEEYREMLQGPLDYIRGETAGSFLVLGDVSLGYVVEADVAAFYQYVDHDILRREIQMQTGHIEGADHLAAFLGETERRTFGIPQLLDASDWLSEIYIRIVERDLGRKNLLVWRYNDDFRIGVEDFGQALGALEELAASVRLVGLTLNDYKTRTPSMMTYIGNNTSLKIDSKEQQIDPQDVEVIVGEYLPEFEAESVAEALDTLGRLESTSDRFIDVRNITSADVRDLRRAVNALARNTHSDGLDYAVYLFFFVPSLTPRIANYLLQLFPIKSVRVAAIWDQLISSKSLSDWQAIWLTYVGRQLNLFFWNVPRLEWCRSNLRVGRGGLLAAESAMALAVADEIEASELDRAIRIEPEVLSPWYVMAVGELARRSGKKDDAERIANSLAGHQPFAWLLDR